MRQDVVNIAGIGVFQGDIEADLVKCSGLGKAAGAINCRRMEVAGVFTTTNRVNAQEVEIKGLLKSTADFSAERFVVMGAVSIDALLNAGNIDIQFDRFGKIREVGAESVSIRPILHNWKGSGGRFMDNFLNLFGNRRFKIEVVEGNEIYLENVEVGTVRGENIVIGPNCSVQYLEYTHKAKVHDSSMVIQMKGEKPVGF